MLLPSSPTWTKQQLVQACLLGRAKQSLGRAPGLQSLRARAGSIRGPSQDEVLAALTMEMQGAPISRPDAASEEPAADAEEAARRSGVSRRKRARPAFEVCARPVRSRWLEGVCMMHAGCVMPSVYHCSDR